MLYRPRTIPAWTFLAIVLLKVYVTFALTVYLVAFGCGKISEGSQLLPSIGLLIAFVYQQNLIYSALASKNMIQVSAFYTVSVCSLIYLIVSQILPMTLGGGGKTNEPTRSLFGDAQFGPQCSPNLKMVSAVRITVYGACAGLELLVGIVICKAYAWTTGQGNSVSARLKKPYTAFQLLLALLKVALFWLTGNLLLVLASTSPAQRLQLYGTITTLAISVLCIPATYYVVREESKSGTLTVLIAQCAQIGFFVTELVASFPRQSQSGSTAKLMMIRYVRREVLALDIVSVVMLAATFILTILCARNFHLGLRPILRADRPVDSGPGSGSTLRLLRREKPQIGAADAGNVADPAG